MTIDNFTASALADELNEKLAGGRIQDTVQLDRETFGMEVYANRERHYLLLSGDNLAPRAMIVGEKLRRGVPNPTPLGLFFRNRIEGLILQGIRQPPWERILIFEVVGPDGKLEIILELIERRANLILVEDGTILECARRVGADENRYRTILPRQPYILPPPQTEDRLTPDKLNPSKLATLLQRDLKQKAWLALVKGILGMSPQLAKEVVFRAHKDINISAEKANPYALDAALGSFLPALLRRDWRPGVVVDDAENVQGVAVYPLTHLGQWQEMPTLSVALSRYFGALEGSGAYEAAREPIRQQLNNAREKVSRKLASLQRSMRDDSEVEHLKQSGELILAYQYSITKGQTELVAQYDVEGEPLTIKINPEITPLENAQAYFAKYEKAKRARDHLPDLISEVEAELEFFDQLEADLTLAENWQDIGEVQDTLQQGGYWQGKKHQVPKGSRSGPIRVVTPSGFVILVGRNARQNEEVTFKKSDPYDLWLHARGVGGSHVIIKTDARETPDPVILEAASYAAYYSKRRHESKVEVMVAQCRHVRKLKGGHPGQVRVFQERGSVNVAPKKPETD